MHDKVNVSVSLVLLSARLFMSSCLARNIRKQANYNAFLISLFWRLSEKHDLGEIRSLKLDENLVESNPAIPAPGRCFV